MKKFYNWENKSTGCIYGLIKFIQKIKNYVWTWEWNEEFVKYKEPMITRWGTPLVRCMRARTHDRSVKPTEPKTIQMWWSPWGDIDVSPTNEATSRPTKKDEQNLINRYLMYQSSHHNPKGALDRSTMGWLNYCSFVFKSNIPSTTKRSTFFIYL